MSCSHDLSLVIVCYEITTSFLSSSLMELTSRKIHVVEHRAEKNIRGGGASLRCASPYFDHWYQLPIYHKTNGRIQGMYSHYVHTECTVKHKNTIKTTLCLKKRAHL